MINKLYMLVLGLTGCAVVTSAYVMRRYSRRTEAQQHKDDLHTWEGEGGTSAVTETPPLQAQ